MQKILRGKIFKQGGSQAVRIPGKMRFPGFVKDVDFFEVSEYPGCLVIRPILTAEEPADVEAARRVCEVLEVIMALDKTAQETLLEVRKICQR